MQYAFKQDPDAARHPYEKILLYSTGGTIAMQFEESGIRPVAKAASPGDSLRKLDVELEEIVFSNLPSPHLGLPQWLELARQINTSLQNATTLGAVVLHGTDLLPECAQTLELCLATDKPVIVTGSMRAQGEAGYDGARNLENAIRICLALPRGREALVSMGDEIYPARQVLKVNSVSPVSMGPLTGLLGRVVNGEVVFIREPRLAPPALFDPQALLCAPLPAVGLIAPLPGDDGKLVDHFLQTGVQGLVVEAFGAGNLPPLLARRLKAALEQGIPVLIASRCPLGGVHPLYAYEGGAKDLSDAGAVLCGEVPAGKAALFLQLALASRVNLAGINDFFN